MILLESWHFQLGWEWSNPLAYFNLGAFVAGILVLLRLRSRDASGLAWGTWMAAWVLTVGSGLHVLGDLTGVPEGWDHQFIHFAVFVAMLVLLLGVRRD